MPEARVELARDFSHKVLNLARLPISPLRQNRCPRWDLNPQPLCGARILSPLRIPVPPLGHFKTFSGGREGIRTPVYGFCRAMPYLLATRPQSPKFLSQIFVRDRLRLPKYHLSGFLQELLDFKPPLLGLVKPEFNFRNELGLDFLGEMRPELFFQILQRF